MLFFGAIAMCVNLFIVGGLQAGFGHAERLSGSTTWSVDGNTGATYAIFVCSFAISWGPWCVQSPPPRSGQCLSLCALTPTRLLPLAPPLAPGRTLPRSSRRASVPRRSPSLRRPTVRPARPFDRLTAASGADRWISCLPRQGSSTLPSRTPPPRRSRTSSTRLTSSTAVRPFQPLHRPPPTSMRSCADTPFPSAAQPSAPPLPSTSLCVRRPCDVVTMPTTPRH
jgi:hypothetical protein